MAELDRLLTEAEATHRQMLDALTREGAKGVREIIRQRTRFATLVAELLAAIRVDRRMINDPLLAQEFEDRFFVVRKKLAEHQAQWRSAAIEADIEGYRRSVGGLARVQGDFYLWAQVALARI